MYMAKNYKVRSLKHTGSLNSPSVQHKFGKGRALAHPLGVCGSQGASC